MELEMAIRGYQRICTLQSAATPARCREACPSSQCRARRARTMRPTWGNTRTHVSDDITRPSSPRPPKRPFVLAKCVGTHAGRKVVFWKWEEDLQQRELFCTNFFFPKNSELKIYQATGNETERAQRSSLFSTKLSSFISLHWYTGFRPPRPRVPFVLFLSSCRSLHF